MKQNIKHFMLMGLLCLSAGTFAQVHTKNKDNPKTPDLTLNLKKYIDPSNMDLSVKPGDDFFEYADGNWVKNNAIPTKETRWGSFSILHQENTNRLLGILNAISKTPGQPKGGLKQRIGDLYVSGMDSLAIEKRGYDPIKPDLERVAGVSDLDGVIKEAIYERTNGVGSPLFGFRVEQDSKHPAVNVVNFNQGGTSLPDRDNYLKNDDRTKKIQVAYKQYIISLFKLTGASDADAAKNAETIF
ncbi:MAG: M13 family metallopeptidase N-terminal domain-containing protein, partial [Mucilaginibacter sp.]